MSTLASFCGRGGIGVFVGGGDVICLFFDAWFGAVHNSLALGCTVRLCLFAYMVAVLSSLFGALVSVKTDLDSTRFRS